jgi:biotin transport system substrate-specific component
MARNSRNPKIPVSDICLIALFVALNAALAQAAVPFIGGIPLTMQTFAVPLTGAVLGPKRGMLAVSVYVLLGLVAPVYAGGHGGPAVIAGATGGFLLMFPVYAAIVGFTANREKHKRLWLAGGLVLGAVVLFAFGGIAWPLIRGFAPNVGVALTFWVLPFLVGDLAKIITVLAIAPEIQKLMRRATANAS